MALRRSTLVTLTLLGLPATAIGLANTFPPQEMRRNLYADRAACERDYGPAECQPNSGSGASAGYHGPYYAANRSSAAARSDPGPGRTGLVTASETSTRGGFGAFGRAMRAVG